MANPEHVKIVKQGREAIDKWRKKHGGEYLNLSGAELTDVNLTDAELSRADLSHANLPNTDLYGANLTYANLYCANLSYADLSQADLYGADLTGANLYCADLSDANLVRANLSDAHLNNTVLPEANLIDTTLYRATLNTTILTNANLTKAMIANTAWANVDLSTVIGLETIIHDGPSTIGLDTIIRSQGKIPDVFLRGCGVPEEFIRYIPSLIDSMDPIQFYSCFISYSSKDDAFARRLHARLQAEKLGVWFAPEDMRGGRKSLDQIDEAIRVYDRLLLILSPHSMTSDWVQLEIKRAREKERTEKRDVLFPISLVPVSKIKQWKCIDPRTGEDLAEKIIEYHVPTYFSKWKHEDDFEKAFANLMADLRREDAAKT